MPLMCTGETILVEMGTLYIEKSTGFKLLCNRREMSQMLVCHTRQRGICENECSRGRSGFPDRRISVVNSRMYSTIKLSKN
jgi:hypothetical protein